MMRIAIVNDVTLAVEALRSVVTSVPEYQIAWTASDGAEAVQKCAADIPDLILMDLIMPRMDGAEASRRIMRESPCAILIVTATVEGHSSKVFEAMGWGALDAVKTPVLLNSADPAPGSQLLAKIAMIGRLIGKTRSRRTRAPSAPATSKPEQPGRPGFPLIAIGSSTGGPTAVARVLSGLPEDLNAAIAVVQHVDEIFAPGLASWLARESGRDVKIIARGDRVDPSFVQIASTNDHLRLTPGLRLTYTEEPSDYSYRPSADVFFQTVVNHWAGTAVGVLLTGMGDDGAKGLLAMRQAGWHTIAQSPETCIAYGMPKAAAKLGAAVEILPLDQIAGAISRVLSASASLSQRSRS